MVKLKLDGKKLITIIIFCDWFKCVGGGGGGGGEGTDRRVGKELDC